MSSDASQLVRNDENKPAEGQRFVSPPHLTPRYRWAVFFLLAVFGFMLRLPQLGERPMHTDEAVNAYIVGQLLAGKPFVYDPRDRHGPSLPAIALPLARLQGAKTFSDLTESQLRLTSVVVGSFTILLFGAAAEIFGFVPSLIAALLFAVAPLPLYYDRYFIHESIFVTATFGMILTGWRACLRRSTGQAALAGACAAGMLLTKETAVIHFLSLASAALVFWAWNLRGKALDGRWRTRAALAAAATFLLLSVVSITWFGSNWRALGDLAQAIPNFFARAGDEGHRAATSYYLQLLTSGWSGGLLLLLACIGFIQTVRKRTSSPYSFLAYYALFIAGIYSLIPYKTPWLALNFWLPIALFIGLAFASAWSVPAKDASPTGLRAICVVVGAVTAVLIARDTRSRVFLNPADESNPYAYAHTSEDLLGLPAELDRLTRQDGIASPRIAVIASDPWPLPWYLRHVAQVGFWQPGQQPGVADYYITSSDAAGEYEERFKDFRPEFFGLRPGVLIILWAPASK